RRRHTRSKRDWSSDVCSSDLFQFVQVVVGGGCHHLAFVLRCKREHIGEKSLAVFHGQIIKSAATAAILFKVLVGYIPIPEIVIRSEERRVGKECRAPSSTATS